MRNPRWQHSDLWIVVMWNHATQQQPVFGMSTAPRLWPALVRATNSVSLAAEMRSPGLDRKLLCCFCICSGYRNRFCVFDSKHFKMPACSPNTRLLYHVNHFTTVGTRTSANVTADRGPWTTTTFWALHQNLEILSILSLKQAILATTMIDVQAWFAKGLRLSLVLFRALPDL